MTKTPKITCRIRVDEVDNQQFLTTANLAKYLQEVAWEASLLAGTSVHYLRERGLTWVLSRLQLEVKTYPRYTDEISIETWGSSFDKYFIYRDFRIYDKNNDLIGKAISSWLIVDIERGKMISMPEEVVNSYIVNNGESMSMTKAKIPTTHKVDNEYQIVVRWNDLDINQHTNNTHYYRWALDSIPQAILENKRLEYLDIQFKAESKLNENLDVKLEIQEDNFIHQIYNQSSQKECVRMLTKFK